MSANDTKGSERGKLKDFFKLGEVSGYFFRKKDPSRPKNFNLKAMHVINRIAIILFLICVLVILKRYLFGY